MCQVLTMKGCTMDTLNGVFLDDLKERNPTTESVHKVSYKATLDDGSRVDGFVRVRGRSGHSAKKRFRNLMPVDDFRITSVEEEKEVGEE